MANLSEAERLRGWLLHNRLMEQLQQEVVLSVPNVGPDPVPVEKLYFKRPEIYDRIVAKMHEMAPDGVSSQHQFVEILEQAINVVNDELKREMSPDEMADIVLTFNDVERELMFTPFQAINLREANVGMGKEYGWKEELMKIVQDRIKSSGNPGMSKEDLVELLNQVKDEIDNTLGMIYNTLKMVPAAAFFSGK